MNDFLRKLLSGVMDSSIRTKNIIQHIGWSFTYKAGSALANFLSVPLAINYLGIENYGVWLVLSSVLIWFAVFDIGLGNGLRNKLAEARALGDDQVGQGIVSTAYYTVGMIGVLLTVSLFTLNLFLDLSLVLDTAPELNEELSLLIPAIIGFFGIQLVAKLIINIFQADQHHSIHSRVQFLSQILSLGTIWLLTKTEGHSLFIFGSLYSAMPVIILIVLNVVAFGGRFQTLRPKFSLYDKRYLGEISGVGLNFFVIQIATVILFSTDNVIITQLFGPSDVVPYNVALKYFSIVTMGYSTLVAPYWSSFTEAHIQRDKGWIKQSVSSVQRIWFLVPLVLIIMTLVSDQFYDLWLGGQVQVPMHLSIVMAVFVALITFTMIYTYFINGVGKIKLQLFDSIVSMIINVPLSVLFGFYLGWGTAGIMAATCVSLGYAAVLRPIQYYKLVNGTARGIWNK